MVGNESTPTRRTLLRAGVAGAIGAAAGATAYGQFVGDDQPSGTTVTPMPVGDSTPGSETDSGETDELELAHWWHDGPAGDGMDALLSGFEQRHPDIDVDIVTTMTAPTSSDQIRHRVTEGEPPSTWTAWPGANLEPLADHLEPIGDSVWEPTGLKGSVPAPVRALARPGGSLATVPFSVARVNLLYYNVDVLDAAGVDPRSLSAPSDLLAALQAVESETDATPLALQTASPWSTLQLFEAVFAGQHGADALRSLADGEPDRAAIRESLATVAACATHRPDDADSMDWRDAADRLTDGSAAFVQQGTWAAARYVADGLDDGWGVRPFPGTTGQFHALVESFPFPSSNPSPGPTTAFLRYCATVEGQTRFCAPNGSIPARTDVDHERFGRHQRRQVRAYANAEAHHPSITHGLAVVPATLAELKRAVSGFVENGTVDATADALSDALG